MRLLIALFVILLTVLGAGYWLNDPGYVLVRLGDIAAETTLWGGVPNTYGCLGSATSNLRDPTCVLAR